MPVPVKQHRPAGTWFARSKSYSVSVSNFRCSRDVDVAPSNRLMPSRMIVHVMSRVIRIGQHHQASRSQDPTHSRPYRLSTAARYSAFSRSMSHADTSLASVYPHDPAAAARIQRQFRLGRGEFGVHANADRLPWPDAHPRRALKENLRPRLAIDVSVHALACAMLGVAKKLALIS